MNGLHQNDSFFINKLTEIVNRNLQDENFSPNDLANAAGMSRSSIHRKLKASTGLDASRFIRKIRLERSFEMLKNSSDTVSEIAFKVGFGSPAYFTKCFHEYYGYPPVEVRRRLSDDISSVNNHKNQIEEA